MWILLLVLVVIATVPGVGSETPNHLEPIRRDVNVSLSGYDQLVFRTLVREPEPVAWMIVKPSFFPEYAVILSINAPDSAEPYYQLQHAVVREKIWSYKKVDKKTLELDLKSDVGVDRQAARLSAEAADQLIGAWSAVLKKTRPADRDKRWAGLDGVTYEFYVSGDLNGKTWSPKSGVQKLMVDCGELLIEYVKAEDKARDELIQRLSALCGEIQAANE